MEDQPQNTSPLHENPQRLGISSQSQKKWIIIFSVSVGLLLLCIIAGIGFLNTKSKHVPTTITTQPTSTPKTKSQPTTPPQATPEVPSQSLSPQEQQQEQTDIKSQTQSQLDQKINIPYTIAKVKAYGQNWGIVEITNPSTDPANIIVKKVNGTWQVVLGPGTHFDEQQLQSVGAPPSLINDANSNL
ncbi:MAG: hypothetical protein ACR2LN_06030 [Candidatus Levyibacteriota bacterium]